MQLSAAAARLARVRLIVAQPGAGYPEAAAEASRILESVEEALVEMGEDCRSLSGALGGEFVARVDALVSEAEAEASDPPRLLATAGRLAELVGSVYLGFQASCKISAVFAAAAAAVAVASFLLGLLVSDSMLAVVTASVGTGFVVAGALLWRSWPRYPLLQVAGAAMLALMGSQVAPGAATAAVLALGSRLLALRLLEAGVRWGLG